MKKYIVEWKDDEKHFSDVKEAVKFAERISDEICVNSYVLVEIDEVRDKEPFFKCEWSI